MSIFDETGPVAIICAPIRCVPNPKPGSAGVCEKCNDIVWVANTSRQIHKERGGYFVCTGCVEKHKLLDKADMQFPTREQWAEMTPFDRLMAAVLYAENQKKRKETLGSS